jgi:hypothetical protein
LWILKIISWVPNNSVFQNFIIRAPPSFGGYPPYSNQYTQEESSHNTVKFFGGYLSRCSFLTNRSEKVCDHFHVTFCLCLRCFYLNFPLKKTHKFLHMLPYIMSAEQHSVFQNFIIRAPPGFGGYLPYSNHSVRPHFLSYNNSWSYYHPMLYLHGLVFLLTQSMHHCLETVLIKASGLSENEI